MFHSALLLRGTSAAATTTSSSSSSSSQHQNASSPLIGMGFSRPSHAKNACVLAGVSSSSSSRTLTRSSSSTTNIGLTRTERRQNTTRAMSSSHASSSSSSESFRFLPARRTQIGGVCVSHHHHRLRRFRFVLGAEDFVDDGRKGRNASLDLRATRCHLLGAFRTRAIRDSSSSGGGSTEEGDEKKRKTSENSNDESPRGGRRKPYAEEKKEVSARRYVQRRVESSGAYGDISNERLPRKISPSVSSSSSTRQKSSSQPPPNKKIADTRDEIKEKRRKTGRLNNKKETRKSIIDKNEKLKLKPNVKALLNFINGNVQGFSVVNCATAVHKCGTFVRDSKYLRKSSDKKPISLTEVNPNSRSLVEKGGDEGEDEFATNETLIRTCQNILANKHFQKLIRRIEELLPRSNDPNDLRELALDYGTPSSREYSNLLWGLAHCGVQTRLQANEFTTLLLRQYINCAKENNYAKFAAQNVSNVLWAFTIMSPSGKYEDAVDDEKVLYFERDDHNVEDLFSGIPPEQVPQSIRAEFLDAIERLNLNVMEGYVPQGVANCLWSYGTLGYKLRPETEAAFRKGIAMHLGQPRTTSAYGFGAGNFKTQETSNILWACAQLRFDMGKDLASMFLHSMTENLFNDPRVWSVQSLTNILWALATLREQGLGEVYTLPHGLLKRIEDMIEPKIETMFIQGISNTLWAYACLEYEPDHEFLRRMTSRWDDDLHNRSTVENCNAFWAYTKFRNFRPSQKFVDYLAGLQTRCIMVKEKWNADDTSESTKFKNEYTEDTLTIMVFVNTFYGMAEIGAYPNDKGRYFEHVLSEMTEWLKVTYDPHQKNKNCTQPIVNYMRSLALLTYLPNDDFVEIMSKRAKMEAENDQFTVQGISQMLWSWSILGLNIPQDVVYALVQAMIRQMDQATTQSLTTCIWAVANMGFIEEKDIFDVFRKKIATIDIEQFNKYSDKDHPYRFVTGGGSKGEMSLNQIYQAHFAYEILSPFGKLIYPELESEAKKSWMEVTRTCVTISGFHQEVSSTLSEMGVPHELEFLTEGGLYSLDIALKGRKICIEADGPTHYSINRPTVRIGGDNLREAILTKQGWTVIQIPWFTWQAALERDRREYIANLLYEHAGLTMKQLTAGAREQASLRDLGADVFMSELNTPDTKPSSTTFSPYGMDFEKPSSPSSSSPSSSSPPSFSRSLASSTPERKKSDPTGALRATTSGRIKKPSTSSSSPSSSSSSSSRVIQPVAPGTRRVSAKFPRRVVSSVTKNASSLSDAESKRLAEKLGSRKVEAPTDEGGSPKARKVVKRVKRVVPSKENDAVAAADATKMKKMKKSEAIEEEEKE